MAYSAGDTILDDHYNIFVQGGASAVDHNTANVNTIWGAGTGNKGYGQSGTLSTVSAGSTITATQWANLLNRCTTLANHQGITLSSITNPSAGDTISAYSTLSTNITDITNHRLDAAGNGTDITTNGTNSTTSTWSASATITKTITFDSADEAQKFWNAGGMVRFSFSLTGGSDDKSTEWGDLMSQVGTLAITEGSTSQTIAGTTYTGTTKIGGSGTANTHNTGTGWSDLTTSWSTLYKHYADTNPYTSNYITIEAQATSSTVLKIRATLTDAAAEDTSQDGTGTGDDLDIVDGTLSMTTVIRPPSTTYLTNTWGTPSQDAPSWSVS